MDTEENEFGNGGFDSFEAEVTPVQNEENDPFKLFGGANGGGGDNNSGISKEKDPFDAFN